MMQLGYREQDVPFHDSVRYLLLILIAEDENVYILHYVEFYFIFFLSVVGLNELAEQVDQTKQVS